MQNKPMIIMLIILQLCICISEVIKHGRFIKLHTGLTVNEKIQHVIFYRQFDW